MRAIPFILCVILLAGCGPKNGTLPEGHEPEVKYVPPENMPPWEIVYTRSTTTDVGDCENLEIMDKEVHITPKGVTVYISHYTDPLNPPSDKKLISTIPADEEPAKSVIEAVVQKGYWQFDEHASYQLSADLLDDCSDESEDIVIETPSKTGILYFTLGADHPPATGMALELHTLLSDKL